MSTQQASIYILGMFTGVGIYALADALRIWLTKRAEPPVYHKCKDCGLEHAVYPTGKVHALRPSVKDCKHPTCSQVGRYWVCDNCLHGKLLSEGCDKRGVVGEALGRAPNEEAKQSTPIVLGVKPDPKLHCGHGVLWNVPCPECRKVWEAKRGAPFPPTAPTARDLNESQPLCPHNVPVIAHCAQCHAANLARWANQTDV
jgi:hypothetical protein